MNDRRVLILLMTLLFLSILTPIALAEISVEKHSKWVQVYNDNPDFYTVVTDSKKHDSGIYLCSKTAEKTQELKDLDFATSFNRWQKELKSKAKLKPDKITFSDFVWYNPLTWFNEDPEAVCYYYKPSKDERFLKFGKHSTHLVYTNESIEIYEDGDLIGESTLTTENYNYVNDKPNINIFPGKNQLVHKFLITDYSDTANIIEDVKFIDMRDNQTIEKNYSIVQLVYENVSKPYYHYTCPNNDYNHMELCSKEVVAYNYSIELVEKEINYSELEEGQDYLFGVKTDVGVREYFDVIPKINGVYVDVWATVKGDLSTGLVSFYKFDEESTNGGTIIDQRGTYNGTNNNLDSKIGFFNNSYNFSSINTGHADLNSNLGLTGSQERTFCAWVNYDTYGLIDVNGVFFAGGTLNTGQKYSFFLSESDEKLGVSIQGAAYFTNLGVNKNEWNLVCVAFDGTTLGDNTIYVGYPNGSLYSEGASGAAGINTGVGEYWIGESPIDVADQNWEGRIDHVGIWNISLSSSQIETFFNDANGIEYEILDQDPTVLLNSPANATSYESNGINVDFNCTAYDDINLQNVTLTIYNQSDNSLYASSTNTSGINNTFYTFSEVLMAGNYTWNCVAYDNSSQIGTNDTNRTVIVYPIPDNAPEVNLLYPQDELLLVEIPENFELICNATDDYQIDNVSLIINDLVNQTNTSGINNTNYTFTYPFGDGNYTWSCRATDNSSQETQPTARWFNIDTTPFIEFISPTEPNNTNFTTTNTIPVKVNITPLTYYDNWTGYLYNDSGLYDSITFDDTITTEYNFTGLPDGNYYLNATYFINTSKFNDTETRYYGVDINDPEVEITAPADGFVVTEFNQSIDLNWSISDTHLDSCWYQTRASTEFDGVTEETIPLNCSDNTTIFNYPENNPDNVSIFLYANDTYGNTNYDNVTIYKNTTKPSVNITFPRENFGELDNGDIINLNFTFEGNITTLDTCWYDYNNVNTSFNCSENTTITYVDGYDNITVYVNDTLNNIGSDSVEWIVYFVSLGATYDEDVFETQSTNFKYSVSVESSVVSAYSTLTYNNTNYTTTSTEYDTNKINFTRTLSVPIVGEDTNKTFFWTIYYTINDTQYSYVTDTFTQNVSEFNITNCSSPVGLALNFTTYDTTDFEIMNASFEISMEYKVVGSTISTPKTFSYKSVNENKSNWLFCVNTNEANATVDATVSYYETGYDRREYLIEDGTVGNFTQNIKLYLTPTVDSDIVTITVLDETLTEVVGATVYTQLWDVGSDSYFTIGMFKTDSSGQGFMNLVLYNKWYRFIVIFEGDVVKVTENEKLSTTDKTIYVTLGVENNYENFNNIQGEVTYNNNTGVVTFTFVDTSGYSREGCLVVRKSNLTGVYKIYDNCVDSSAGILSTTVTENGSYTAYGEVILSEEYGGLVKILDETSFVIGDLEAYIVNKGFGSFISYLLIATAGIIGVVAESIMLGLGLLVIVLLLVSNAGWLNITPTVFWGIVVLIIVILSRMFRRFG